MGKRKRYEPIPSEALKEAREAYHLADSQPQVALKRIQDVCDKYPRGYGILFLTQAQILEICSNKAETSDDKKGYLEKAIDIAIMTTEYDLHSMVFTSMLAHLLYKGLTHVDKCKEAIQEFNTALLIKDPTDPFDESILTDEEKLTSFAPTYGQRIACLRKDILNDLGGFVLKLKELHTDPAVIKSILHRLKVSKEEKVKLYWISLSPDEKQKWLQVDIQALRYSLISSDKYLARNVLSEAISFYEVHDKWESWTCCVCNKAFSDSGQHFFHVVTHLGELYSKLTRPFPLRIDDWIPIINGITWEPIDTSGASTMLAEKWESVSSTRNNEGAVQYLLNEQNVQENPKWDCPLSGDSNRAALLSMIQERLKELLLGKHLLEAHIVILIERAMSKLEGFPGDLLRKLGLDKTHYCLCLLDASQLEEILRLLQEISDFSMKIFKKESVIEETLDFGSRAFKINGKISMNIDSWHLILAEHTLCNESTSGSSSEKGDHTGAHTPATSVPPTVDYLASWIYSDDTGDEHLKQWRDLRNERSRRGKEKLDKYKQRLSEILKHVHTYQEVQSVDIVATNVSNLEQNPQEDTSIQATIHKKSDNNESELSEIDKCVLQVAVDMHQLEIILNCFAAYSYQPILLSIVKPYIRKHLEGIMDNNAGNKSDAATERNWGNKLVIQDSYGDEGFNQAEVESTKRQNLERYRGKKLVIQESYGDEGFYQAEVERAKRQKLAADEYVGDSGTEENPENYVYGVDLTSFLADCG